MKIKTYFLAIILTTASIAAHAQDKIYKNNGTIIDAKVKTVGEKTIVYKRFDNQDGPEYTILKYDVIKIVYQNGTTDDFMHFAEDHDMGDHAGKKKKYVKKYGDNIFTVTPLAYTEAIDGNINDVGFGVGYERQLDQRGHLSFTLPVMISFSSNRDFNNNNSYTYTGVTYGTYTSYYLMPGIKFYPADSRRKVRYSLGASLFCIFGSEPYAVYDNGQSGQTGNYNYEMYGLMLSNSLNISATKHLFMALEINTGFPISDNRYAYNDNQGIEFLLPVLQLAFKVGLRY